jgi:16S rRNA (guanine527-N7)-methyltransferase
VTKSASSHSPDTLTAALDRYQLALPDAWIQRLDEYCHLLWQTNEKLNLTRHTTYEQFVGRDVADSLQLVPLLASGESVLDVGTGGGVPGIVLALVRPDLEVSLCESVAKKATAVRQIAGQLKLAVPVYHARVEDLLTDSHGYDALTARAVGPLWKILDWLRPHWKSVGRLLVVKGPRWAEERQEARQRGYLRDLHLRRMVSYQMPLTESEGVVLGIWPRTRARG